MSVEVGAIVIVEAHSWSDKSPSRSSATEIDGARRFVEGPLAFVDLLGRSLLELTIERLIAANVKVTSLIIHPEVVAQMPVFRGAFGNLSVRVADEVWSAVAQILENYSRNNIGCAFVVKPNAYAETDFLDLVDFHLQGQRSVTRASDQQGPIDLWIMNCDVAREKDISPLTTALMQPDFFPASYFVKEYVKRIESPADFRHLVIDAFSQRCNLQPLGEQVRPGVWVDKGAEIQRGARVVGPAYLGARCTVGETALITRFSNLERGSYIDYGTAIEDSSILPNTYVGIWLDVRHSVVHANKLLHIEHGVMVEISDPILLRSNVAGPKPVSSVSAIPVASREAHKSPPQKHRFANIRSVNARTEFES